MYKYHESHDYITVTLNYVDKIRKNMV